MDDNSYFCSAFKLTLILGGLSGSPALDMVLRTRFQWQLTRTDQDFSPSFDSSFLHSELNVEGVVRVVLVGVGQEGQDDPAALLLVELVDGGDVVVGELKVEDGGVLLDPLRLGRLGHHGHAPLDVPSEDDLLEVMEIIR